MASRVVNKFIEHSMHKNDGYVKRNLAEVHIYLQSHQIHVIKEEPDYEMSQLLSDLGGVIGLYLGVAIASAVEACEFVALAIYFTVFGDGKQENRPLSEGEGARQKSWNSKRIQKNASVVKISIASTQEEIPSIQDD